MILDAAFMLLIAGATALGARVGAPAATVALAAPFLWLLLAPIGPLALLAAIPLGILPLAAGRAVRLRRRPRVAAALGGVGGAALAIVLCATLATALPLQRDPTEPDVAILHYPPRNLPGPWSGWLRESSLLTVGAQVRLAPLAAADGRTSDGLPARAAATFAAPGVASALHPLVARIGWTWDARP